MCKNLDRDRPRNIQHFLDPAEFEKLETQSHHVTTNRIQNKKIQDSGQQLYSMKCHLLFQILSMIPKWNAFSVHVL